MSQVKVIRAFWLRYLGLQLVLEWAQHCQQHGTKSSDEPVMKVIRPSRINLLQMKLCVGNKSDVFVIHCFILQNGLHVKYLCNWCHGPCRWPVNWSLTHQSSSECCCCPKGPNKEPVMQWLPIPLHHYPPLNEAPAWVFELLRVWVVTGSPASVQQIAPHTASTVSVNRLTRGLLTFMAPTCLQTHTGWGMQDVQDMQLKHTREENWELAAFRRKLWPESVLV